MDRHSHREPLLAPPPNGGSARAYAPGVEGRPAAGSWPKLDDHLVKPEVTRDEVVRGQRMIAMPSRPEHGDRHFGLDYVLGAHIQRDYVGSTDLITRFSQGSDFATDTCIRKTGTNPETGERYLEEVAFEVVHTQSDKQIRTRAEDLSARGVRRFFAIFVKKGTVGEWSVKDKIFLFLDIDGEISDPTLATPVRVRALLDAVEADNGVARALLAKNNPVLQAEQQRRHAQGLEEGREEGLLAGKATAVLAVLAARGHSVSPSLRETILACADEQRLDAWLVKAATAASADELLDVAPSSKPDSARGVGAASPSSGSARGATGPRRTDVARGSRRSDRKPR